VSDKNRSQGHLLSHRLSLRSIGPITCVCILTGGVPAHAQAPAPTLITDIETPDATAIAPRADTPGFGTVFQETLTDFRRLPSKDTLAWLGGAAIAATIAHSFDRSTTSALSGARSLERMFEPGKAFGGHFQLAGSLATLAAGRVSGSPTVTRVGADLVRAQLVSQALTVGVKVAARRTRPDGTQFSFPSGHTSATFATATVLQRDLGWKVGLVSYGVATYVAASRIQERRHFLSDVAFGAAIGIVAGRTVTMGSGGARFAVAPMATPGGAGISFDWVGGR
jgi:membrane-associated phospholipid phosphatase